MTQTFINRLDFWFDFASTYSYPAAMRLEAAAQERGVSVRYRPFLLGPIFADQGWRNSPFNIYPAKGRYMWRDLERICADEGLPWVQPDPFPQNSLLAARATLALAQEARGAFIRAVFSAEFSQGKAIAERGVLAEILTQLGHNAAQVLERATTDAVKLRLKSETDEARRLGIFGAPSFVAEDGELFWGNDRLIQALDWAVGRAGAKN